MAQTCYYEGNGRVGAALKASLERAGFEFVNTAEEAAFVFTYFPDAQELEDRYFDENGLMQKAAKGAYLIDLSPTTPNYAREMSAVASVSDLFFVEAPLAVNDVTLGNCFATQSNLACCVAAESSDREVVVPVLKNFVGSVCEFNEPGSAQLAHAAWTLQFAASLLSAIEAEALYRSMRYIPTSAAVACSSGEVPVMGPLQYGVVQAVAEKRFVSDYTVEMLKCDLNAALSAADDAELILPQAEACSNLLDLLAVIGGADKSPIALTMIYDEEHVAAENGMDWSRAEGYSQPVVVDDDYDSELGSGRYDDDDDDFGGYANLFGNFSEN